MREKWLFGLDSLVISTKQIPELAPHVDERIAKFQEIAAMAETEVEKNDWELEIAEARQARDELLSHMGTSAYSEAYALV